MNRTPGIKQMNDKQLDPNIPYHGDGVFVRMLSHKFNMPSDLKQGIIYPWQEEAASV
jgi:hypothetical protein